MAIGRSPGTCWNLLPNFRAISLSSNRLNRVSHDFVLTGGVGVLLGTNMRCRRPDPCDKSFTPLPRGCIIWQRATRLGVTKRPGPVRPCVTQSRVRRSHPWPARQVPHPQIAAGTRTIVRTPPPGVRRLHLTVWFTVAYVMLGSCRCKTSSRGRPGAVVDLTVRNACVPVGSPPARSGCDTEPAQSSASVARAAATAPMLGEHVELADSVSMAMLLVLETLAPTERAVFRAAARVCFGVRRDRGRRRQEPGRRPSDRALGAGRMLRRAGGAARIPAEPETALEAFQRRSRRVILQSLLRPARTGRRPVGDGGEAKQGRAAADRGRRRPFAAGGRPAPIRWHGVGRAGAE